MSSTPATPLVIATVLALAGCGRSPEAQTPMKVVRVDSGTAVICNCDDDEDYDEEDELVRRPKPVEYVRMTEWQPPPSAQRVESEITPRGTAPPSYIEFPRLQLHRPIDQPRPRPMGVYFGRRR